MVPNVSVMVPYVHVIRKLVWEVTVANIVHVRKCVSVITILQDAYLNVHLSAILIHVVIV